MDGRVIKYYYRLFFGLCHKIIHKSNASFCIVSVLVNLVKQVVFAGHQPDDIKAFTPSCR